MKEGVQCCILCHKFPDKGIKYNTGKDDFYKMHLSQTMKT